jgi:excisionase family DNA binding protein
MASLTSLPARAVKGSACLHAARQLKQAASSHVAELNSDAILTKRQAAGYVQTTERYLERMAAIGRLRVFKPTGKLWRVRKSDLDAFLESGATIGGGPQ